MSNEYDNEIIERKPRVYQLEIKEIWTPNLAIAKYNVDREKPSKYKYDIEDNDDFEKEYNEYINYIAPLEKYFNNVFDFYDIVIFSSNNLKELMKPGDIIQMDFIYRDSPFKLNENVTLFIFDAYKALYPKILVEDITKSIFDPLYNLIRPTDGLFFTTYVILRSVDVSFRELKRVWNFIFIKDFVKYSNEINTINNNLEKYTNYIEFVKNFLIHHFPFDNYNIPKDVFDNKTITDLLDNLEPLRIMMKKTKKEKIDPKKIEESFDIKLPKGGDLYKDFVEFKRKVISTLRGDHPLIKAYFNSIKGFT
jgi:hypothetical protein